VRGHRTKLFGLLIALIVCSVYPCQAAGGAIHITTQAQRDEVHTDAEHITLFSMEHTVDLQWKQPLKTNQSFFIGGTYVLHSEELYVDNAEGNVAAQTNKRNGFAEYHIGWEYAFDYGAFENTWRFSWHIPGSIEQSATTVPYPGQQPIHDLQGQWVVSRTRDPVVVYAGAGVVHPLMKQYGVVKGTRYTWQGGLIHALTRDTSIRGSLALSWKAPDRTQKHVMHATKRTDATTAFNIMHTLNSHIIAEFGTTIDLVTPKHSLLQMGVRYIL